MKKNYSVPEITVIENKIEPTMLDTSLIYGGEYGGGSVDSKGANNGYLEFDDLCEEEQDEWEACWGNKKETAYNGFRFGK